MCPKSMSRRSWIASSRLATRLADWRRCGATAVALDDSGEAIAEPRLRPVASLHRRSRSKQRDRRRPFAGAQV